MKKTIFITALFISNLIFAGTITIGQGPVLGTLFGEDTYYEELTDWTADDLRGLNPQGDAANVSPDDGYYWSRDLIAAYSRLENNNLYFRADLFDLAIGAEGGTNRVMGLVAKQITPNDIIACSRKLARFSILPEYSFVVGFPDEKNWEDTKATLAFMARVRKIAPNALAEYFYYTPFPGTPLFKDYASKYMPRAKTIEDFVQFNTYDASMPWVDEKLRRLLKMASSFFFKFAIPDDSMRAGMTSGGPVGYGLRLINRLSDWRVRHRRYGFPIEYWLGRFAKDVLIGKLGLFKRLRGVL